MSFYFSKSKFVAAYTRCNKYAWLDKNKPKEKAEVSEFTESLFDNGHKVGELAKQYFNIDVDITVFRENGAQDNTAMIAETQKHLDLGTKRIAEASFSFGGFSILMQIKSILKDTFINYKLFILSRLVVTCISIFICWCT